MRDYPHFPSYELRCKCGCDGGQMDDVFMETLVSMRKNAGFSFPITSAYRCPDYNAQVSGTGRDGPHTTGKAVDIQVSGDLASEVIELAMIYEFPGLGVSQKGKHGSRFIHIDSARAKRWVWSY